MCQEQHSLKHAAIQQHGRDTTAVSAIASCENLFLSDISNDHQVAPSCNFFSLSLCFSSFLLIFPSGVLGNSSMNSISRGYSCLESLFLTNACLSFASASAGSYPAFSLIKAFTRSPRSLSGLPTTAHSSTAGCFIRLPSTSIGPMVYPAEMMTSSILETYQK